MQLDLFCDGPRVLAGKPEKAASSMMANEVESARADEEEKSAGAFKTISEAAEILGVPQHVLRFWEGKFKQIKPLKLRGGRRYYRPEDMEVLVAIKTLLYKQGYTIKGAKKALGLHTPADDSATQEALRQSAADTKSRKLDALAAIRPQLIDLRDALKPHIF